jgi:hypothetical protein
MRKTTDKNSRALVTACIVAMALLTSGAAQASWYSDTWSSIKKPFAYRPPPSWGRGFGKGFDAVVLRPLGTTAVIVGGGLLVPAAILGAFNGREGFEEAKETFLTAQVESTFKRPLGEF